jgi:HK97 gp10 family phage protein
MASKAEVTVVVISNRLPKMPAAIRKAVAGQIEKTARTIEAGAKRDVAIDTGNLRRSIHTTIGNGGLAATVAAGTTYAIFVERGTRRMVARPFLIPNFEREAPKLVAAVHSVLRDL